MRHRKAGRKLNRTMAHRQMMLRNMVTSLFRHDLSARRQALRVINDKGVVKKLFEEIAPRYRDRSGGYTHLYRVGFRRGDGAPMSVIELVPVPKEEAP